MGREKGSNLKLNYSQQTCIATLSHVEYMYLHWVSNVTVIYINDSFLAVLSTRIGASDVTCLISWIPVSSEYSVTHNFCSI